MERVYLRRDDGEASNEIPYTRQCREGKLKCCVGVSVGVSTRASA
jgi:hypothetical protein